MTENKINKLQNAAVRLLFLQLSLKTKWFKMTEAGVKTEDYREITSYWIKRLVECVLDEQGNITKPIGDYAQVDYCRFIFKPFTQNTMTLGYPKSTDKERILSLEHKGIEIRTGKPQWGAEPNKLYFVIKHGAIIG